MKKIFLVSVIFLILIFLGNPTYAKERPIGFEIGGVFPIIPEAGTTLILPYGAFNMNFRPLPILKLKTSLGVIPLIIIPIFTVSGDIILEFPNEDYYPYLGVGVRNFGILSEGFNFSNFIAEFIGGIKFITGVGKVFLELNYFTSTSVFYGEYVGGFYAVKAGIEF